MTACREKIRLPRVKISLHYGSGFVYGRETTSIAPAPPRLPLDRDTHLAYAGELLERVGDLLVHELHPLYEQYMSAGIGWRKESDRVRRCLY